MIKYEKNNSIFSNYTSIFNDNLYKPITNLNIGNIVENHKSYKDFHLDTTNNYYPCNLVFNN
jgi:hypothetical protein